MSVLANIGGFLLFILLLVYYVAYWIGCSKVLLKMGVPKKYALFPLFHIWVIYAQVFGGVVNAIIILALSFIVGVLPHALGILIYFSLKMVFGLRLAHSFCKSQSFGVGLGLLPAVFLLIIAYDDSAQYYVLKDFSFAHPLQMEYYGDDNYSNVNNSGMDDYFETSNNTKQFQNGVMSKTESDDKVCVNCGNRIKIGDSFCTNCGNRV